MEIWAAAVTRFQFISTEFTVTGNATPAACVEIPTEDFPVEDPGNAVSPGTNTWSLVALLTDTVNVDEMTVEELASSAAPERRVAVKKLVAVDVKSVKAYVVVPVKDLV